MSARPHYPSQALSADVELRTVAGIVQTLQLLPVCQAELVDVVDSAVSSNPMVERIPGSPCPSCGRHIRHGRCPTCAGRSTVDEESRAAPIDELRILALCEVRTDCRALMSLVLDHLLPRGTLDMSPAEIADLHGVRLADVSECVRAVRQVGPVGIAEISARDLLAAQAAVLVDRGVAEPWLVTLVRNHLELVAARDTATAAHLVGATESSMVRAFDLVADRLRPHLGLGTAQEDAPRIPPDIYVHRNDDGTLVAEAADSRFFGLRTATIPPELAHRPDALAWLRTHEREAHTLLRQLDARAHMLRTVACAAVDYQAAYLSGGPTAHRPLTRSALATSLGVHPSTVSRAVRGKRVRLPDGDVVDFADLFGTAVAVRAEIALATQGRRMSDRELCGELATRGYVVSRRAVAKYRAQLGIPAGGNPRN